MLYTQTGRQIHEYWDSPYRNAWTKFMSRGRYVQLTSVLHVNDNSDEERRTQDSLHKIQPLLNILKKKHLGNMPFLEMNCHMMKPQWQTSQALAGV